MAKIVQPDVETPNTKNSEVQITSQINSPKPTLSTNTTYSVQPNPNNYATSGISKPVQNNQQVQPIKTNQPTQQQVQNNIAQNQGSSVVVQRPSDYYDTTVQGYLNAYDEGVRINDYQAQINALTAIDNYRVSKGYEPIYAQNIYELTNQRTQKIQRIINDYDNQIAEATNNGNYELAQQIGQQLNEYKRSVNYTDPVANAATYIQNTQYKSSYEDVVNGLVSELLTMRFTYDPSDDQALAKAQSHAANVAMEKMNAKGILDSTMTAQVVSSAVAELEPIYRKMAKEEFYENLERMQSMANFIIDLDNNQYDRWLNNVKFNLSYYDALKDEMSYQWDRVNQLGYVDNAASVILGIAPGTMSPSMREAIQKNEAEAQKRYDELMSDIALAEAKAQLDVSTYQQKQAIAASYDVNTYAQKQAIAAKYKTTNTTGNGSLSATTLKNQLDNMDGSDYEKLMFAVANAKDDNAYADAVSYLGMTLDQASELLENPMQEYYNDKKYGKYLEKIEAKVGEITEENLAEADEYALELVEGLRKVGATHKDMASTIKVLETDAELEELLEILEKIAYSRTEG